VLTEDQGEGFWSWRCVRDGQDDPRYPRPEYQWLVSSTQGERATSTLVRLRFEAPRNRRAGKSLALHAGGNACRYMELVLHDMYPPPSAEPLWRKAVN